MKGAEQGMALVGSAHVYAETARWVRAYCAGAAPCVDLRDVPAIMAAEARAILVSVGQPSYVTALSADGAEREDVHRAAAEGWAGPLAGAFEALERLTANRAIGDEVLLDTIEAAADGMWTLLEEMDVEALADAIETAMAEAIVGEIARRTQRRGHAVRSFAVEGLYGPLEAAVEKSAERQVVGTALRSAQWARLPLALRERAFFSARVESVRFLGAAQEKIRLRLSMEREALAGGKQAFVNRDSFIRDMRRIAEEEGLQTTGPEGRGTVRDIRSVRRLGLIFDQQVRSAQEYARWTMDHDEDVLDEFPAYRLGESTAENPREESFWMARWDEAGERVGWAGASRTEMAALKTSPIWTALSRFGTPWPPYDYGSTRDLEDLDREEAVALGLIGRREAVPQFEGGSGRESFTQGMEASTEGLSAEAMENLTRLFGDEVEIDAEGGRVKWRTPE